MLWKASSAMAGGAFLCYNKHVAANDTSGDYTMKKANAGISLLICILMLIHVLYEVISFVVFFYNPVVTKVLGYVLVAAIVAHAGLSMAIVFGRHDSKTITYKALNIRTLLQRIFAGLMCVLIPLHIFAFKLLSKSVGTVFFSLFLLIMVIFYWSVFSHVALSFTNALVSLGWLGDMKKKKVADIIIWILCFLMFLAASFIITMTQWKMFNG